MQQQQRGVGNKPLMFHTAGSEGTEVVVTSAVPTSTTVESGALQLSSADGRLADQCLAGAHILWSPSVSLSLSEISNCLQASSASTQPADDGPDARASDDSRCPVDTLQWCCAGYGVGEILPSINKYVVSPDTIHTIKSCLHLR